MNEDRYLLIIDRQKDIIVSGGENISSLEVEKALAAHPSVYEVAVIPVPDHKWGEVPKALVVLKPGATAAEEELLELDRKSTRLNSSHRCISYAVFCLKKKKKKNTKYKKKKS